MVACGGGSSSSSAIATVTVTCAPSTLQSGATSQCTATVTGSGSFDSTVTWGTSAGTISSAGLLTAQAVTTSTTVTVTATSNQDTTKVGTVTVTVTPLTSIAVTCIPTAIQPRQTSQCSATANGSVVASVNWSSSIGVISPSGLFTAPQVTATTPAIITATIPANNVSASSAVIVNVNNTAALAVDGGPTVNGTSIGYPNGAYATITVCTPGTTTCQTIDHVLVDTGSVGFRVLSSALGSVALPGQNASDGNPLAECYVTPAGYAWGPVSLALVQVSGEIASSIPVQVIAPSNFSAAPAACTSRTTGGALSTISALKANGILGIGLWVTDCGSACAAGGGLQNVYFSCPAAGCGSIAVATSQQVTNPVTAFPNDNNGSIIAFPPVFSSGSPTAAGTVTFGIGTQSNNAVTGVTVYTVTTSGTNPGSFVSIFNGTPYPGSISSGANANYFLNSVITSYPSCPTSGFYCPTADQTVSLTNAGTNGTSGTVTFVVGNGDSLVSSGNFAFSNLGGPGDGRTSGFLFGIPFFYGRVVFTAINGASTPGGTGPYFAY